jgi:hypothetical protein
MLWVMTRTGIGGRGYTLGIVLGEKDGDAVDSGRICIVSLVLLATVESYSRSATLDFRCLGIAFSHPISCRTGADI